jgi:glycosyltransferase involved in cell wall biosynthesis
MISLMAENNGASASLQQSKSVVFFYATRAISVEAPTSVARSLGLTIEWLNAHYPAWQIEAICPPGGKAGQARFHTADLESRDQTWLRFRRSFGWVHRETRWAPKAVNIAAQAGLDPDLVITVSSYVAREVRQHYPKTKLIYWVRNLPAPSEEGTVFKGLKVADAVVVPSQAIYQAMWQLFSRDSFPAPVWIIPNRLDQRRFNPATPSDRAGQRRKLGLADSDIAIVHVGGTAVHKGRHIAEQALKLCHVNGHRVVLLSAGGNQQQRHALGNNLELVELGLLQPDALADLYHACDLGVVPSLCWESYSMATTEMMSAGLCVIASNTGGIPENLQDQQNGWLIKNPNELREWAHALEQTIINPELRQRLADNAKQTARVRFGPGSTEVDEHWHQLLRHLIES